MTIQRATFHESWYRVADLRPRIRSTLQTYRQQYRGQIWHVAQDPSNNRFFRLDESGYQFVGLLDGRRTVREAWRICCEQFGDAAPTQGEAINLLGQLYSSNLLHSDLPSDAQGMFENNRKRVRREVSGFFMNILFARIPVFDPDPLLERWERSIGPLLFGPLGLVTWLALFLTAAYYLVGRFDDLVGDAAAVIAPGNAFLLYFTFAIVKALHELGHGFACKRIARLTGSGGDVHTFGITFLVFTPLPYVDASSSWIFRNKWHRAMVGAAGMYVEIAIAATAAIVWANTSPGLVHAIAYNVIFVASVSTILFNANPLFRFDGYYILSDLLEIPNLSTRARDHLLYLVRRYLFGVSQAESQIVADGEQFWLPLYGLLAAAYRVVISAGIILFVADKFLLLGLILALSAVISWAVMPLGRVVRYLATAPELSRVRPRAIGATLVLLLFFGSVIGLVPIPERARAEGVLEPVDMAFVHAEVDGFVEWVMPTGYDVLPDGEPLLVARNPDLELELTRLLAEHELTSLQHEAANDGEIALAQTLAERRLVLEQQIELLRERETALSLPAPAAGRWVAPDIDRLRGAYIERGDRLGVIANVNHLHVRAVADQRLGPRLESARDGGEVSVRVRGRPDLEFRGRVREILPAGFRRLPAASLGFPAGGSTQVAADDPSGTTAVDPFFEVHLDVTDEAVRANALVPGQRVVVRFDLPARPLGAIAWHSLRQLVQRRFEI